MSTYQEALSFLFSQLPMFSRTGAAAYKPGLDTSLELDRYFGQPHRLFKSIHVAGTNGKGSTSHTLAAVLQSQGFRVGLYTSPHLVDLRERMKVNGEMIPEDKVVEFVDKWRSCGYPGHPSFFELTMMMAFDWFAHEHVNYAVIEVGMGGRLDSTNIITPELCVITNISNDHTQFLGETLPDIAREKAGIIKPGIPVVVGEAEGIIRTVFEEKAASEKAPVVFAEDTPIAKHLFKSSKGWEASTPWGDVVFPLSGDYQKKNLETALHAIEMMKESGITISSEAVVNGINNADSITGLRGRWSILNQNPLVIADTGHNVAGISYNVAQLESLMSQRKNAKLRMVIGFVADKALDKIIPLLPKGAEYYITNASIPRALPAAELKKLTEAAGLNGKSFSNVKRAYEAAFADAGENDIIFVGGSTFIVADFFA